MIKYLALLFLVGCSQGPVTYTYELNWQQIRDDSRFQLNIDAAVMDALHNIDNEFKAGAKECSRVGKCLGKATYLHLNPRSSYHGWWDCRAADTDKRVTCDQDGT